ncbi:MAG: LytR/AlgR family response regulator transcription factor [Mangrovibacterium sp.]
MRTIKAIIIDDSPAAVDDLCKKLEGNPAVEICGHANSFCDGIKLVKEKKPHLLFLDIRMPGKNGFDLLFWLRDNLQQIPYLIFVTGFDSFVLQALREGALDYLIKPVKVDELEKAIEKAKKAVEKDAQSRKLDALLNYVDGNRQLFLPSAIGFSSVNTHDIVYIWRNTQSGRVEIVLGEDKKFSLPMNYSLSQLVERLSRSDFFQVKRELIINVRYVKEIHTFSRDCILQKGDFVVKLQMSRRNMKDFRDRMGGI